MILATSPFIAVTEKNPALLEQLLVTFGAPLLPFGPLCVSTLLSGCNVRADHRNFDVDDTLCHNVARVLTSLIESKNSATGLLGYAASNRDVVAKKFFASMDCDAMLFIYLEMIGASEDKVRAQSLVWSRLYSMLVTSSDSGCYRSGWRIWRGTAATLRS